jgi:hypothetical protein
VLSVSFSAAHGSQLVSDVVVRGRSMSGRLVFHGRPPIDLYEAWQKQSELSRRDLRLLKNEAYSMVWGRRLLKQVVYR